MIPYQTSFGYLEIFTMFWKTTVLLSVVLCALGNEHATSEQYVKIVHKGKHSDYGKLSHIGPKEAEHHEEYASSYPSYEFSYKVNDPHTHDIKGQEESREGDKVKGEYWLEQPDGRKRIVKYKADKHSGFHAEVTYSEDHKDKKAEDSDKKEETYAEEDKAEEKVEEKVEEKLEENVEEKPENKSEEKPEEKLEEKLEEKHSKKEEKDEENEYSEDKGSHYEEKEGKWIKDHYWGYLDDKKYNKVKYDHHDVDRYSHGYSKLEGRKNNKFAAQGSYKGHNGGYEVHEKSLESRYQPKYHGLNEQDANWAQKQRAIFREHYVHPRLYRHHKSQLKMSIE